MASDPLAPLAPPAALALPHSPLGLYLVVNHISKKANVRTLMTSAAAFGAGVIVGASNSMPTRPFWSLDFN